MGAASAAPVRRKCVIDMRKASLLDSRHFVLRASSRWAFSRVGLVFVLALAALPGCATRSSTSTSVEDTQTSGRIRIVAGPELMALIRRETQMFSTTHPQAAFDLAEASSPEAVSALYAGHADLIALPRELSARERDAAIGGGLELEGYVFGRAALAAVVHESNPVENVSTFELRRILRGEVGSWSGLGGEDARIALVLPSLEGETALSVAHQLLDSASIQAPTRVVATDSAVVAAVSADRAALGFTDASALPAQGVRALRVAPLDGLTYVKPDAETIHDGRYPLARPLHLYMRTGGPRLAGGFITHVTSHEGQRVVLEAGFVPTAVPVRFVRRSPLQSSH